MNTSDLQEAVQWVYERCVEVGDCWEWQGATLSVRGNTPVMRWYRQHITVRRMLATLRGMPVEGRLVTSRCCNEMCVSPEHLQVLTRKQLQQRTARVTQMHLDPARARKLALAARKKSKLTEDQVAAIRAAEGATQRELAERFNITQASVSAIRRGVKWKDYRNPWLGLMGGNR